MCEKNKRVFSNKKKSNKLRGKISLDGIKS